MPKPNPIIRRELKIHNYCLRSQAAQRLIPSPHRQALKISKPFENQQETHKALAKLRRTPKGLTASGSVQTWSERGGFFASITSGVECLAHSPGNYQHPLGQKVGTIPSLQRVIFFFLIGLSLFFLAGALCLCCTPEPVLTRRKLSGLSGAWVWWLRTGDTAQSRDWGRMGDLQS